MIGIEVVQGNNMKFKFGRRVTGLRQAAVAVALLAGGVCNALAGGGSLDPVNPSASFANTVTGGFTDTWTFNLGTPSIVAASLTNVQITFGGFEVGGILDFAAALNGTTLFGPTSVVNTPPITVTTQVLAGAASLGAGLYQLVVSGSGVTGASASYGGNIVATPVPEPEPYVMLLAGLGVVGFVAARRRPRR